MTDPAYEYPDGYQPPVPQYQQAYTSAPPPRKSKLGWIIAAVAILVLLAGGTGVLLYVNAHPKVSVEQQLHDWRLAARDDILALSSTMKLLADSAQNGTVADVSAACVVMEADVDKLRKHLPTPDAKLSDEFEQALDAYHSAAVLCQTMESYPEVTAVSDYIDTGNTHVKLATDILDDAEVRLQKQQKG